jgi:hypothetical protein
MRRTRSFNQFAVSLDDDTGDVFLALTHGSGATF